MILLIILLPLIGSLFLIPIKEYSTNNSSFSSGVYYSQEEIENNKSKIKVSFSSSKFIQQMMMVVKFIQVDCSFKPKSPFSAKITFKLS